MGGSLNGPGICRHICLVSCLIIDNDLKIKSRIMRDFIYSQVPGLIIIRVTVYISYQFILTRL